ncbi:hypothetical protein [Candidatus Pollutiaquabacter sp.]|uniref:hypothetical protein n=1 Tax=Candidatus Pollutiaquabacter sp. TaxID=3416354 RepID=UPI003CB4B5E7|nr:hypothetical protein [Bacteroidota bacterium]
MQHVTAGDARNSKLYQSITLGADRMPPDGRDPLLDEEITTIYVWIQQGAKNNQLLPPMKKTIPAALLIVSGLTACYYDNFEEIHPTIPGGTTVSFPTPYPMRPIFNPS